MPTLTLTYDKDTYAPGETITATLAVSGLAAAQPEQRVHYEGPATVLLNDQTTLQDTDGLDVVKPAVPAQTVASRTLALNASSKSILMTETSTPGVFTGVAKL